MRIILMIDSAPIYVGALQTDAEVPRMNEEVIYNNKNYTVGRVAWDLDEGEIRVYLSNGK